MKLSIKRTLNYSSLQVASLITFSGGFLDAFTYVGHGKVFANAMTGNVVLLGIYTVAGNWQQASMHVFSIIAFLIGVYIAHRIRQAGSGKYFQDFATASLVLEILFLAIVSFLPASFPDIILILSISLVAAVQNSSFAKLEDLTYNSVMTTANLRRFAEAVYEYSVSRKPESKKGIKLFGLICLWFLAGAVAGGTATAHWHNKALWIAIVALISALVLCWERK
jgi:uncharacterized membrane protein YoaK (UPF0700 family)